MTCGLVRIRLARFGRTNNPIYNIVVTNSKKARDAKPIEVLGVYNPIPVKNNKKSKQKDNVAVQLKNVELDFDRAKYWIGVGAQPSDIVTKLFIKSNILGTEWSKRAALDRKVVIPMRKTME
ncbi:hypothetical protein TPHA_0D00800 [Tetrapisispora phaffii CBS 4417]|uniref:Ribosomal protein S16 n=1 Tax=Tetrapisispora phaffii (strain ATCC 24235 / CBS 4417 / NBRC 1672 / NRRL Y-8282 / UCD 70-5) TaxID=1071381 RepID=G8BSA2_TETPH|nr:mitochondrial 37S ribosomal protein MRPS16 TPHA_0D00800 [Tetrapisispora phaffii CBS 4417]CCE62723.1 hypothetical protein TPHA_0D00800 [Tetrapisispora phaffii CBS 4417]